MKAFRASLFTRANYAVLGIVACRSARRPAPHWVECDAAEIAGLIPLWASGDVQFYGQPEAAQ